jgi:SAM-dependent methyltransferase
MARPVHKENAKMTPFCLKSGYVSREVPDYFDDVLTDSTYWQADVYQLAAQLARETLAWRLVDIGCGRAEKLLTFAEEFSLAGYDFGANIDYLKAAHASEGRWWNVDLGATPIKNPDLFQDSVVICADIIEHLPDPSALMATLRTACKAASYVLISTPDRERIHHGDHDGPPANKHHVREWTNSELVQYLRSEDLPVQWHGWTVSHRKYADQLWTSLAIISKHLILGLPPVFEPAPIIWDGIGVKNA